MDIIKIINDKYQQNNYLVVDNDNVLLIDGSAKVSQIEECLKMYNIKPKLDGILLTHAHFDHISEVDNLVARYNCPVYIHEFGKDNLYDYEKNVSYLDDQPFKIKEKKGIRKFKDGQELTFGSIKVNCYNTPGHSEDSSCFFIEDNMFTGDTVFKSQVGRTDLYSADDNMQRISLIRILNDLSNGINTFFPAHGPNFDIDALRYNLSRFLGDI